MIYLEKDLELCKARRHQNFFAEFLGRRYIPL